MAYAHKWIEAEGRVIEAEGRVIEAGTAEQVN